VGVSARIDAARDALVLEVSDDGRGLPSVPGDKGLGLGSMARRAEEVGGRCTIERAGAAGGTRGRGDFPREDG
jgi:signal transduction histidine kinase